MEQSLQRALAGPDMRPEERRELRQRLLDRHPVVSAPDRAQTNGRRAETMSERTKRRVRLGWPQRAVLILAALVMVVGAMRIVLQRGPAAEFGQLPPPGARLEPALSGAGGPGISFELEYVLGAQLTGGWPRLGTRQLAYRLMPLSFTEQRVATIAERLDIDAAVVQEGWQDGYLLAADPGDGGPALRMYPGGYTIYTAPYDYRELERGQLPTEARAVSRAREWLISSGLATANLGPGRVTEDLENGRLYIRFEMAEPHDIVTLAPWAQVEMGAGEQIVSGSSVWFGLDINSGYPVRPVGEAWQDARAGRGTVSWETREWPGPVPDDNIVRGALNANEVRLAWALALAADDTPYLVPVYVFGGEIEAPDGEGGQVRVPSSVWVPAVTEQYRGM